MPVCKNPACAYIKPHLHKRGGVWLARPSGYFLTRLTTEVKRQQGLKDCLRLAEHWNTFNA